MMIYLATVHIIILYIRVVHVDISTGGFGKELILEPLLRQSQLLSLTVIAHTTLAVKLHPSASCLRFNPQTPYDSPYRPRTNEDVYVCCYCSRCDLFYYNEFVQYNMYSSLTRSLDYQRILRNL